MEYTRQKTIQRLQSANPYKKKEVLKTKGHEYQQESGFMLHTERRAKQKLNQYLKEKQLQQIEKENGMEKMDQDIYQIDSDNCTEKIYYQANSQCQSPKQRQFKQNKGFYNSAKQFNKENLNAHQNDDLDNQLEELFDKYLDQNDHDTQTKQKELPITISKVNQFEALDQNQNHLNYQSQNIKKQGNNNLYKIQQQKMNEKIQEIKQKYQPNLNKGNQKRPSTGVKRPQTANHIKKNYNIQSGQLLAVGNGIGNNQGDKNREQDLFDQFYEQQQQKRKKQLQNQELIYKYLPKKSQQQQNDNTEENQSHITSTTGSPQKEETNSKRKKIDQILNKNKESPSNQVLQVDDFEDFNNIQNGDIQIKELEEEQIQDQSREIKNLQKKQSQKNEETFKADPVEMLLQNNKNNQSNRNLSKKGRRTSKLISEHNLSNYYDKEVEDMYDDEQNYKSNKMFNIYSKQKTYHPQMFQNQKKNTIKFERPQTGCNTKYPQGYGYIQKAKTLNNNQPRNSFGDKNTIPLSRHQNINININNNKKNDDLEKLVDGMFDQMANQEFQDAHVEDKGKRQEQDGNAHERRIRQNFTNKRSPQIQKINKNGGMGYETNHMNYANFYDQTKTKQIQGNKHNYKGNMVSGNIAQILENQAKQKKDKKPPVPRFAHPNQQLNNEKKEQEMEAQKYQLKNIQNIVMGDSKKADRAPNLQQTYQSRRPTTALQRTNNNAKLGFINNLIGETFYKNHGTGLDNYKLGQAIGKGSYAVVKLAEDQTTNKKVAIKTYDKFKLIDHNRRANLRREVQLLQQIDHKNVIKLYETVDTRTNINLVMEYIGSMTLRQYIKEQTDKRIQENEVKVIFTQVVDAINYLHSHNINHRDIKLENIMVCPKTLNLKLIDFGFAIRSDSKLTIFCGTPSYMSPEIVKKQDYYGKPSDIWALGILLFAMLFGKFPFRGNNDTELYRRIGKCDLKIPQNTISGGAQNLLQKILKANAKERLTARDILKDPWLL